MNRATAEAVRLHQHVTGVDKSGDGALMQAAAQDMTERGGVFALLRGLEAYAVWFKRTARKPSSYLGAALADPDWWFSGLARLAQLQREELEALGRAYGVPVWRTGKVLAFTTAQAAA